MRLSKGFDKRIHCMLSISMLDDTLLTHLSLETLRTFVAAAEFKSFTKAGQTIHRTQSAVSMQLKRLESDLGRRLFERNARSVRLTHDGELLLHYARRLLRLHDETLACFCGPRLSGLVRLGVPDDYATRYLPGVLARFAWAYPKIRVDVRCDTTGELIKEFKSGKLDVCLTTEDGEEIREQGKPVARVPLLWMSAADLDLHSIWRGTCEPLPLAVFHEGCLQRRWALEALERLGFAYRIAFSSLSLAAIHAAVAAGFAVTPMVKSCCGPGCGFLSDDCGLPRLPEVTVALHVRHAPEHPAVACLAEFVEDRFQETV